MKSIIFLTLEQTLELHDVILELGGVSGVRDLPLLESALLQPQISLYGEYLYKDIFEMAAAYCYHLIKNHPFVDGNKRTGLLAALIFLEENGYKIASSPDDLYDLALETASSQRSKEEIAAFFRAHSSQIEL